MSVEEARELAAKRRRLEHRRRVLRWAALGAVLIAIVVVAYFRYGPPSRVSPSDPAISSAPVNGEWPMYRRDPTHSGASPAQDFMPKGEIVWQFETAPPLEASPAVAGGTAFLATGDKRIIALDAETGASKWQTEVSGPVDSSPAVAGGLIFVGFRDGRIIAFDISDGSQRWEYQTDDIIFASPVVSRGIVYIGSSDGGLYALDAATGKRFWRSSSGGRIIQGAAVRDEILAVISQDRRVYLMDADSGQIRLDIGIRETPGSPAIDDDFVYVADSGGRVRAIDWAQRDLPFEKTARWARTQAFLWGWVTTLPQHKGLKWIFTSRAQNFPYTPTLTKDHVLVGSESGKLYALGKGDGILAWTFEADAEISAPPIVAGETVYVGDAEGSIYGLDSKTGEETWRFSITGDVKTVIVAGDTMFVASGTGTLYAIR